MNIILLCFHREKLSNKQTSIQCINVEIMEIGGDCADFNYCSKLSMYMWNWGSKRWIFPPHLRCQQIHPNPFYMDRALLEWSLFSTAIFLLSLFTHSNDNYSVQSNIEPEMATSSSAQLAALCCHCNPNHTIFDHTTKLNSTKSICSISYEMAVFSDFLSNCLYFSFEFLLFFFHF